MIICQLLNHDNLRPILQELWFDFFLSQDFAPILTMIQMTIKFQPQKCTLSLNHLPNLLLFGFHHVSSLCGLTFYTIT